MTNYKPTEIRKQLIEKIDLILAGITSNSSRDKDLEIAQTVQLLSEAYKNLKETKNG